jgi:hypothetical protein
VDLAEKQIREGTASATVITHFLKLATQREKLEQERIIQENKLLAARVTAMEAQGRIEELYTRALAAMRSYAGQDAVDDETDQMLFGPGSHPRSS